MEREKIRMEKQKAEEIITEYLEKIYGFAFKKAFSLDEAEELAAAMTAEVWQSLLSAQEIFNLEGYIWRICEHTYARFVMQVKKQEGISMDSLSEFPYHEAFYGENDEEEIERLRREICYLSALRRDIVFRFYYKKEPISSISAKLNLPEGTVKWHLNKSRKDLKEGMSMERKIGRLGMNPVEADCISHDGRPGKNGGPEFYLGDKLNLNIVYSVYFEPKTLTGIAEELGVNPVFIEDKVTVLEENGFLVRTKGNKFTTYVEFTPRTFSKEKWDRVLLYKKEFARVLIQNYVPLVRKAVEEIRDVYVPGGNRELFEAAAVIYAALKNFCPKDENRPDKGKYYIRTTDGGCYVVTVVLKVECPDPEYQMKMDGDYYACGSMLRCSQKYPVTSWSIDTHFDLRKGQWENNWNADYEYVYEWMQGKLSDGPEDAEKIKRLRERGFLDENGKIRIMIVQGTEEEFAAHFDKIPLDEKTRERFAKIALENAVQEAKLYPPQMQDLVMAGAQYFIDSPMIAILLEELYAGGTFRSLAEEEKIAANLLMFSDILPQESMAIGIL